MSKEHLNYLRRKTADEAELWAADRIEELERQLNQPVVMSEWQTLVQERDQLREQVKMLRDAIEYSGAAKSCQGLADALAATGKDFEGLVVCHAKPLAWARYPRFTGVAQTTPVVVFKKPDGKDWTPLFATTEQKP